MQSSRTDQRQSGDVAAHPAGQSAQARAGEFERMIERLRQTERYLAARYQCVVRRAQPPRALLIDLDAMRDAVDMAIDELTAKGKA